MLIIFQILQQHARPTIGLWDGLPSGLVALRPGLVRPRHAIGRLCGSGRDYGSARSLCTRYQPQRRREHGGRQQSHGA